MEAVVIVRAYGSDRERALIVDVDVDNDNEWICCMRCMQGVGDKQMAESVANIRRPDTRMKSTDRHTAESLANVRWTDRRRNR